MPESQELGALDQFDLKLLAALEAARAMEMVTVGFTGIGANAKFLRRQTLGASRSRAGEQLTFRNHPAHLQGQDGR